jgi:hypothetical protein
MASIDIEEAKRISAKFIRRPPHMQVHVTSTPLIENTRAIETLLRKYFSRTSLPIDALNALMASRQAELRNRFKAQSAENAKDLRSKQIGFRQSMDNRRAALQLLSSPFQSTLLMLDQPFLIWAYPKLDLDVLIAWEYLPGDSFIKLKGVDNPVANYYNQFVFDFFWSNDSEFAAVINVATSLVFTGGCEIDSAAGFFSGDHNTLGLYANLDILRYNGWGTDPVTGQSLDQTPLPNAQPTQGQQVVYLDVTGGGLFAGEKTKGQLFDFQSFDLSRDLIAVPAGASLLFTAAVNLSYSMSDPLNISDSVFFDFADDTLGRQIVCPGLTLEILTPVSGVNE